MERVTVSFEHCYGIKKMDAEFDFSKKAAQLIYAPNGAMKSSFATTFLDHSSSSDSEDRIYPERATKRLILDHDGNELSADSVFVVQPYNADYQSGRVSTLLVNKALKEEYDAILKSIREKEEALISKVKKDAGVRSGVEEIISTVISKKPDNLLRSLERVRTEVNEEEFDSSLEGIKLGTLFNDKVENFLADPNIKAALEDYTATYDSLLEKSRFFRKGIFNHYQAGEIAKQLKNHGFFQAEHKVYLNSNGQETKVETEKELEALISEELQGILSNEGLKSQFEKIDKKLSNRELRDFREFLLEHQTLIPRFQNVEAFKEDLLKSYFMLHKDEFNELIDPAP